MTVKVEPETYPMRGCWQCVQICTNSLCRQKESRREILLVIQYIVNQIVYVSMNYRCVQ